MTKNKLPCPTVLRQLLRYEPETGILYWLPRSEFWFSGKNPSTSAKKFNTRRANKRAFTAIGADGYFVGRVFDISLRAHRVAWAIYYGEWPNKDIDHINRNPLDNRIENLREASRSENLANSIRKHGKTSKHRGVRKSFGKWEARISQNNKSITLGRFEFERDAAEAYNKAAKKLWGECAILNRLDC